MIRALVVVAAVFVCLGTSFAQEVSRDGPALSPFRGMRAVDGGIEVQVADDTWFALEKVAGVDTTTLLRESKRLCGDHAWKRLTEDLPALLAAMGHTVGPTVDLEVRDLANGQVHALPGVALTKANRERLRDANRRADRVAAVPPAAPIPAADARADLDVLRSLLDERFAYRHLRGVDVEPLLAAAREKLGEGPVEPAAFVRIVDSVLRAFGDGHSRVDGVAPARNVFLPCLVQGVEGGHVAFRADRSAFVDPDRPFVVAIDGLPLAKWLDAARRRATQGSAAMQAREAERLLRDLGDLRDDLGVPAADTVRLRLLGRQGERELELPVAGRRQSFGAWPRAATRRIGDRGYLRIAEMRGDVEFLDGLDASMQSFRGTKGLVIDVRGNGGGSRDALRRLASWLLPPGDKPVVANVAAPLRDGDRPLAVDALADRGLHPVEWTGWSDAQRTAIAAFARTFRPSWQPTPGKFGPWQFLVLDRSDSVPAFAYEGPVVVLIDRGCFSATDVFAAALGALPKVTLVGEPTSGGSGRARAFVLPRSGVRLQLSSMASYRPDGVLFEGNGVVPDVGVAVQPGDLIGITDTALQRALDLLR